MSEHVCGKLCHLRGAVWWPAHQARDPRKYLLDGKLLTKEEYDADPNSICHVDIVPA